MAVAPGILPNPEAPGPAIGPQPPAPAPDAYRPAAYPGQRTAVDALADWIDTRTGIGPLFRASTHVRVPASAMTFYLGGLTLFLFGVQVVTGILMGLYYKPTPDAAYDSVKFITSGVSFGWLIRSVHHWGADLMIACLMLHVVRIFFQGAFKHRRELLWLVGIGLLAVTIGFGFTGYLLPWDQRAFWATTVGTEIAGSVPFAGDALLTLLRGGADVTEATLTRFFAMHVLVLPVLLAGLIGAHLLIVHHVGVANTREPEPNGPIPGTKTKPFWPDYVLDEMVAWYFVLAILVVLASVFPAGLEDKANALETPQHVKPEWYFLFLYEFLKFVPRIVGILAPMVGLVILALLPFIDRNPEVRLRKRPLAFVLGVLTIVGIVALTVMSLS